MSPTTRPRIRCRIGCRGPHIGGPICGTDGMTYSSRCDLHAYNCGARKHGEKSVDIGVAHEGECNTGSSDTFAEDCRKNPRKCAYLEPDYIQ